MAKDPIYSLIAQWGDMEIQEENYRAAGKPVPVGIQREKNLILSHLNSVRDANGNSLMHPHYLNTLAKAVADYKNDRYLMQKRQVENLEKVQKATAEELKARELTSGLPGIDKGVPKRRLGEFERKLEKGEVFKVGEREVHLGDEHHRRYTMNKAFDAQIAKEAEINAAAGEDDLGIDPEDLAFRKAARQETEDLHKHKLIREDGESMRETFIRSWDASEAGQGYISRHEQAEEEATDAT